MNPTREKIQGKYRGGGRGEETCDRGLSRTPLMVKTSAELSREVKVMADKKKTSY